MQRGVLVLDPLNDKWDSDFKTSDQEAFLEAVWASECCDVFVDEAGDAIGHYDRVMIRLATRGRHWGHNCYFVTQDEKSVSPIVRSQCSFLFCFAMSKDRAKMLADEWNHPELVQVSQFPAGQCLMVPRFGSAKRINVFGE